MATEFDETSTPESSQEGDEQPEWCPGLQRERSHPNDIMHQHWYETTVRLRASFSMFFILCLSLALALGVTTQLFFSVASSNGVGGSTGQAMGLLLVPLLLLTTAVLLDEMVDLGMDAMALPSLGLTRATLTASVRAVWPSFSIVSAEKCVLVGTEGFPIVGAVLFQALEGGYAALKGYIVGGLASCFLLATLYIAAHVHVNSDPKRDALLAVYFHYAGHMGEFKDVVPPEAEAMLHFHPPRHPRRALWLLGAVVAMISVELAVVAAGVRNVALLFVGQLFSSVLFAMAIHAYAPRVLGRAFWVGFVGFLVLAVGLLCGTSAIREGSPVRPLALGPGAAEYGEAVDGNLPLAFEAQELVCSPGYPVCSASWGHRGAAERLGILDMALLAYASSFENQSAVERGLEEMFAGTGLGPWRLLYVEPSNTVGRWIVVEFPRQRLRVVAVRGTSTVEDVFADLQVYSAIAALQLMSFVWPLLTTLPSTVVQSFCRSELASVMLGSHKVGDKLVAAVERQKDEAANASQTLVVTGHSLGGALAGVASASASVEGVGFSAPGLYYQRHRYNISMQPLQHGFTIVAPDHDVVPHVDEQRGMVAWIGCHTSAPTCHRLTKTACELWTQCGDARKRDWRRVCAEWYGREQVNSPENSQGTAR